MTENDPKNMNNDNFDKEFSLNRQKKSAGHGKFPSWIMILAGVAVIGGVVAAKSPVIRPETGTWSSINAPIGSTATVSQAFYNGMNDEKAASSELEARFTSHTEGSSSAKSEHLFMTGDDRVFSMEMEPLKVDENGDVLSAEENGDSSVYWVDEKPYALTLKPAEKADDDSGSENVSSVYNIDDREYSVHLEVVSEDEIAALSDADLKKIVHAGDNAYLLDLVPADESEMKAAADTQKENGGDDAVPEPDTKPSKPGSGSKTDNSVSADADTFETEQTPSPSQKAELPAVSDQSKTVVWMDGKPYAVSVKPYSEGQPAKDAAENAGTEQSDNPEKSKPASGAAISDTDDRNAATETESDRPSVSSGEKPVMISGPADTEAADKTDAAAAATSDPQKEAADDTAESGTHESKDDSAGSMMDSKTQSGKTADQTSAENSVVLDPETEAAIRAGAGRFDISEDQLVQAVPIGEEQNEEFSDKAKVNVPVTILDDEDDEKSDENVRTAVFEVNGKKYEISVAEMDPEEAPSEGAEKPVVWMDTVPLVVSLQSGSVSDSVKDTDSSEESEFDIVLDAVPDEEMPALYEEHFGEPLVSETEQKNPEPEETVETEEPADGPSGENTESDKPEKENWFVSVFHNVFGNEPTATPTPEPKVTTITATPEPTEVKPKATAIVVRFHPTSTPQSPVRLDGPTKTPIPQDHYSDWDDPALWEDKDDETLSIINRRATVTAVSQQPTFTPMRPTQVQVTVVVSDGKDWPTAQPEPKELPQTGMAESWNIPSMLALLAGLLLIIIGVRRLRKSGQQ